MAERAYGRGEEGRWKEGGEGGRGRREREGKEGERGTEEEEEDGKGEKGRDEVERRKKKTGSISLPLLAAFLSNSSNV